jgi:hypothetical protein
MKNRMLRPTWAAVLSLAVAGSACAQGGPASLAAGTPSLQEQLEAQYPLGKMSTQGRCAISNPETAVILQKPGIGALPAKAYTPVCSTHYKDGKVGGPGFWCRQYLQTAKQEMVTLESGDRVYITKFEVNPSKGEVRASIGYCAQTTTYNADMVFQFPKKFLDTASVNQVEDTIAEVFSPDTAQQAQAQPPPAPGNAPAVTQQQASVEIGQSVDQVVSALGEPDTKAQGAGTKTIYIWKARKLKVTFVDGKVADVD